MPTFRTAPSNSLSSAIQRAMGSANLAPEVQVQAEMAAAKTAKDLSLAQKARAEVEQMNRAEADRTNPKLATEYAGNVAGLDSAKSTRLADHLRGVLEQPGPADIDDAAAVGKEAQPFVTGAPNVTSGQQRGFQTALASLIANRLATGKTNAEQLAKAGGDINKTSLVNEATDTTDVPNANRLIAAAAGKIREPFKTNAQGTVLNEETGNLNEGTKLAGVVRGHVGAQATQAAAAAERDRAHAGLYTAQTANAKEGVGKPPSGYAWGPKNADGQSTLVRIPGGPADTTGGKLEGDALDMAADRYRLDGTLPPNLGRGAQGAANTVAVLTKAAEKAKALGQDGEAARITQLANKASGTALTQLSKQEAMVGAFEKNFNKNADLAIAQSNKVDRTGVPALNRWVLAGKKNIAGDPDVAVLDTAIKASVNEYTKIISGSMGNAAMAEGEIKKVEGLLSSASTPQQVVAVLNFMKKETGNRMTSFADQKAELTKGMRGAPAAAPAGGDIEKRFSADPAVKGMKLGTVKDGKAEVLDAAGKLVGYYE